MNYKTVNIPEPIHRELKEEASRRGIKLQEVVEERLLNNNEQNEGNKI